MKATVVTGASTGIGFAAAKALAKAGHHVFGSVRKEEDAERLAAELGQAFTPLLFDVTDPAAVARGAAKVGKALGSARLHGLVNNAGIAVSAPLMHIPLADMDKQMRVNVLGPVIATQAFLPLLGSDAARTGAPGRIVNISSVSGKIAFPFVGAYAASKFALEALSDAFRRELMIYGVDVVVIGPGAVVTPIWDKAAEADLSAFSQTDYGPVLERFTDFFIKEGRKGLKPEIVARKIVQVLDAKSPKARYALVRGAFANWTLPRLLPARLLDKVIAGRLGLTRLR